MNTAKTKRIATATANLEAAKARYAEAIAMNQPFCILEKARIKVWIAQDRMDRALAA